MKEKREDVICEEADDCVRKVPCGHRRIHEKNEMCSVSRCSTGGRVGCIKPTDGQIVMQKLLDMQDEVAAQDKPRIVATNLNLTHRVVR